MNYYTLRIISFILLLLVLLILFRFVIREKINNEKTYNKYLITINEISSKGISGIIISYPVYDGENLINDSLDNKFEKITQKDNLNGATFDTIFTTFDQLLDDKYTIYFGKQEYKPLN